jgi:bifunctional non-homologous end joining protein LigD
MPIDPMLAESLDRNLSTVDENDWIAEVKYDGSRVMAYIDGEVKLVTRRGHDRTSELAEVADELQQLPDGTVLDGELAFFDDSGVSQFLPLQTDKENIRSKGLRMKYIVFDIVRHRGKDLTETELRERKKILEEVMYEGDYICSASFTTDGFQDLYQDTLDRGQEGIMLKKRDSWYYPGSRSRVWRKVKSFQEKDLIAVGYTTGEGSRASSFGSLVLTDGEKYVGKVGSGFTEEQLHRIKESMVEKGRTPQYRGQVGEYYQPIEPFTVAIKYQEISGDNKLRSPVFLQVENKPLDEIQPL